MEARMAAAMSASYLRCSSSGYRYVGPLAVGFVGFAGVAPAGGEDVPAAPLTPGMDRMAGSSMSPSEPNEDRRTCPCVGGCATGTVVPGGGYTGCPCGVVSTVPGSGDPTGVAGASESVSNGPSPSDPPARESPSSPSFAFAPERGLNARLSLSRTQDVMPGPAPPAPPTRKVAHAPRKFFPRLTDARVA